VLPKRGVQDMQKRLVTFFHHQQEEKLLMVLIFLGLLVRLVNFTAASAIDIDGIGYASAAKDFVHGAFGNAFGSIRLPAYPAAIALFHLFIPDVELAGRVTSLVFGILLILLCFRFIRARWGLKTGLWAATLVALHPYMAQYSVRVLSESLATFLFTASIFCFYEGWTTEKTGDLLWSGVLLACAYLTRAEYIIYFIPLSCVLIVQKGRTKSIPAFLICPLLLTLSFLAYLRLHTGFWVIDKKILDWGGAGGGMDIYSYLTRVVSIRAVMKNIPAVSYHFCEAVYLPLLALAILGFKKTDSRFRNLALLLIVVHLVGRSFVFHTTKRYSIEFVPLTLVFAVNGIGVVREFLHRYPRERLIQAGLFLATSMVLLWGGILPSNHGREMEKRAGIIMRAYGPRSVIASRLPIIAFYAEGTWVSLDDMAKGNPPCSELRGRLDSKKAAYMAVDDRVEKTFPLVPGCIAGREPVIDLARGKEYVRVYRLAP